MIQCVVASKILFTAGLSLAASLVLAACASGGVPDAGTRVADLGDTPDLPLIIDLSVVDAGCTPACTAAQVCRSGICVDPATDADGDGIPAAEDCDDTTSGIGRLAERSCSSACGTGVERCSSGVWSACTAPVACDCTAGAPPRDVPCGLCGVQQQICVGGAWTNAGSCNASGECSAGTVEPGGSCGRCGTSARTCGADCLWGGTTCTGEGECTAGATETDTASCGCGTQSRTRTCSAACGWGAWSAFGACSGGGVCAAGATRLGSCTDSCSQEVCTSGCAWGSCGLAPGNACNYNSGTNWRSCTGGSCTSASCWQFCGSTCQYYTCQNR